MHVVYLNKYEKSHFHPPKLLITIYIYIYPKAALMILLAYNLLKNLYYNVRCKPLQWFFLHKFYMAISFIVTVEEYMWHLTQTACKAYNYNNLFLFHNYNNIHSCTYLYNDIYMHTYVPQYCSFKDAF